MEEINENKKFVNEKSYTGKEDVFSFKPTSFLSMRQDLTETESKLKPLESVFLKQRRECFKQVKRNKEVDLTIIFCVDK